MRLYIDPEYYNGVDDEHREGFIPEASKEIEILTYFQRMGKRTVDQRQFL